MTVTIHARGLSEAQLMAQAGHETTKLYREHGGAFIYRSESPKAEQTADFTITNLCTDKPHVVVSFTMIRRDLQTGAMEPAALEDTLTLSVLDLEVKTGTRKKRTLTSNNLITVALGQTLEVGFCFEHVVSSDKSNARVGIRFDSDDLGAPFYSEFYYVASKVSATKQPRAAPETAAPHKLRGRNFEKAEARALAPADQDAHQAGRNNRQAADGAARQPHQQHRAIHRHRRRHAGHAVDRE